MKNLIVFTNNSFYVDEIANKVRDIDTSPIVVTQAGTIDDIKAHNLEETDSEVVYILSPTYYSLASVFLLSVLAHKYGNRLIILYKPYESVGNDEVAFSPIKQKEVITLFKTPTFVNIEVYLGHTNSIIEPLYYRLIDEKFSNVVYNIEGFSFNRGSILALRDWVETEEKKVEIDFETKDLILKALILLNERNNSK